MGDVAEAAEGVVHDPTTIFDFKWRAHPPISIPPRLRRRQFVGVPGPMIDPSLNVYDAFVQICNRSMIVHIVVETNRHAQLRASTKRYSDEGKLVQIVVFHSGKTLT